MMPRRNFLLIISSRYDQNINAYKRRGNLKKKKSKNITLRKLEHLEFRWAQQEENENF